MSAVGRKLEKGLPRVDMYSPEFRKRAEQRRAAAAAAGVATSDDQVPQHRVAAGVVAEAREQAAAIVSAAREEAARIVAAAISEAVNVASVRSPVEVSQSDGSKRAARDIMRETADRHGVTLDDLTGVSRSATVARARQEAMVLVRLLRPDLSTPQIGRLFGNRDHTTVLYALRKSNLTAGAKAAADE